MFRYDQVQMCHDCFLMARQKDDTVIQWPVPYTIVFPFLSPPVVTEQNSTV